MDKFVKDRSIPDGTQIWVHWNPGLNQLQLKDLNNVGLATVDQVYLTDAYFFSKKNVWERFNKSKSHKSPLFALIVGTYSIQPFKINNARKLKCSPRLSPFFITADTNMPVFYAEKVRLNKLLIFADGIAAKVEE